MLKQHQTNVFTCIVGYVKKKFEFDDICQIFLFSRTFTLFAQCWWVTWSFLSFVLEFKRNCIKIAQYM